ncbi:MAG: 2-oxoglutarate dehydrogenase complex dihydrolipoyllysine-residue succinyltransferase [Bacteroidota bacterium]|nr:2-oxoglutarate dehydrogenase complex dihydrolipoyllysine-residue succinyltransferase [Bacteroidota bacterium]
MAIEIKVPTVGESITEVTIARWLKQDGDHVELDDVLCEIESDKATFELNAEASGTLKITAREGDTVAVGDLIASIDTVGKAAPKSEEPAAAEASGTSEPAKKEAGKQTYASGHAAPAAAKILSEKGLAPEAVKGTGKDGRITKDDAVKANGQTAKQESEDRLTEKPSKDAMKDKEKDAPKKQAAPARTFEGERGTSREKMTTLRKTIARRLVEVRNTTAMLTTFNEVDMTGIMEMRKKYKDSFKEKHQVGLGFMSFFTKAVCLALQEFPAVNAQIDDQEIIYHDYVDMGVAVSTPRGLVVPNIRNADKMTLAEIEMAIMDLAGKARDGKVTIEDMTGGTFTITNGGVFGSLMSTPILNAPQSAILGMHNIVERPMAIDGQVVIRPMMYVALSYDHRIIDGKESVSFLVRVKQLLEDPARMMLGV